MRNQSVRAFVRVLALLSLLGTTLGVLAKRGYGVVAEFIEIHQGFRGIGPVTVTFEWKCVQSDVLDLHRLINPGVNLLFSL